MSDDQVYSIRISSFVTENYAAVNGINLYYQIHGHHTTVSPLILLHGGFGQIEMFAYILPVLAEDRLVIAVDLQAHGRTMDIDRPIRFESMADDIAALIQHLGFENADVMGYSLGGGAALQTAIRHPRRVRKLVLVSMPTRREGWYPEVLKGMGQVGAQAAEAMKQSPMYQSYVRVAPKPEDWPVLMTKMGDLLRQDYDWSADFARMKMPTLIVVGDADGIRTAHAVEMYELLGGGQGDAGWDGSGRVASRLAVLPGTTHYNSFQSPLLAPVVLPFLDEPMPEIK